MNAYIFDLDGTLLDSMDVWEKIDAEFLTRRGLAVPSDYAQAVGSRSFPEAAQYTIERFGLPDSVNDVLLEWKNLALYAYGNTVPLKPHAREYLEALKARGVKLGIATSLSADLYEPALRNHGIMDLFSVICSTDEVQFGKTKPDVFLLAAEKLGLAPGECAVFEDILPAIKSAKQAGMTVYGVYDESSKDCWALIQKIADGVLLDFQNAPLPK
ncbi:MAG: HAD family phosphatase [Oscillospiraceae bacterium]|nr:HAD family phosphatase [Oscillospiraceae bacterium]